jgi:hypothetical protein
MPGSIFQSSLSSINPDTEPPKRGQSLPGWVLDMLHPAATG